LVLWLPPRRRVERGPMTERERVDWDERYRHAGPVGRVNGTPFMELVATRRPGPGTLLEIAGGRGAVSPQSRAVDYLYPFSPLILHNPSYLTTPDYWMDH
jgi:hypothetical protein